MTQLERLVLAHRFLYYVLARPVISDPEYAELERDAERVAPTDSPIYRPGSDLADSYAPDIQALAHSLLEAAQP